MTSSSTSAYTFDNMTRINNDSCALDQNDIQNINSSNYKLQNYFANDCSMKNPINLATMQPGIMYKGGFSIGTGGCNVDDNSKLTIGSIQDSLNCPIDLFQRPYITVPYLGRGSVNPVIESQILQGDMNINRKSKNNLSEKSYINYSQTPLLSNIKEQLNNPSNYVESVASSGWVRGGIPSREITRDSNQYN